MIEDSKTNKKFKGVHLLYIVLLLIMAMYLYTKDLVQYPLWFDEAWSAHTSTSDLDHLWTIVYHFDVHPPLYYFILHSWQTVAGFTPFALRFMSVMFSLLALAGVYKLGSTLFDEKVGLFAFSLAVFNPFFFKYAQEARSYAFALFLTCIVIYYYWKMMKNNHQRDYVGFVISSSIMLYTSYWALFLLGSLGLYTLLTKWRRTWIYLPIALIFSPWLLVVYNQYTRVQETTEVTPPWILPSTWEAFNEIWQSSLGGPWWLWILLSSFTIVMLAQKKTPQKDAVAFSLIVPLTTIIALFIGNIAVPFLTPRYIYMILPLCLIVFSIAVSRVHYGFIFLTLIVSLTAITTQSDYQRTEKGVRWQEAVQDVVRYANEDDLILTDIGWDDLYILYQSQIESEFKVDTYGIGRAYRFPDLFDYPRSLETQLESHDDIWLIHAGNEYDELLAQYGFRKTATVPNDSFLFQVIRYDRINEQVKTEFAFQNIHAIRVETEVYQDWLSVSFLWQPQTIMEQNITVSVFVLNKGGELVAQHDSIPMEGASPTLSWEPNEYYFDGHAIDISALPSGSYSIGIQLYYFLENDFSEIENVPPRTETCDGCNFIIFDEFTID